MLRPRIVWYDDEREKRVDEVGEDGDQKTRRGASGWYSQQP